VCVVSELVCSESRVSGAAVFNVESICPAANQTDEYSTAFFEKQPVIMYLQAPN
jgi:hypothetical protein